MTAYDLIVSIYRRPLRGRDRLPENVCRITRAQLDFLRKLIDQDEEGCALQRTSSTEMMWMPSGRNKYLLTEDLRDDKHTITTLPNIISGSDGLLF